MEEPVSEFIARDSQLTWTEGLLVGEYADEGTAVEAIRSFMKLAQMKGESLGELGVKATKLSALDFPEEVRENAAIQADLYEKVLQNEPIRHYVIKDAPVRLLIAITLARDSKRM